MRQLDRLNGRFKKHTDMNEPYNIALEKVHFRTSRLRYSDSRGSVEVFLEQSAVPEYDWIGAELDFKVSAARLSEILPRIHEWASAQNLTLKIWPKDQLGV